MNMISYMYEAISKVNRGGAAATQLVLKQFWCKNVISEKTQQHSHSV